MNFNFNYNISGTITLPTGAATSAAQTTGNNSLASIDTKFPVQGQALVVQIEDELMNVAANIGKDAVAVEAKVKSVIDSLVGDMTSTTFVESVISTVETAVSDIKQGVETFVQDVKDFVDPAPPSPPAPPAPPSTP